MANKFISTPAARETTSAPAPVRYARDIRLALPVRARRRLRRWLEQRAAARAAAEAVTHEAMFV